jgi:hypothetical protein
MSKRIQINIPSTGVGTAISFLSMVLHANIPVKLVSGDYAINMMNALIRMFNMNQDLLNTEVWVDPLPTVRLNDCGKVFAPYFNIESIAVLHNGYKVGKRNKPCIGIACYSEADQLYHKSESDKFKVFPHCRQYPIEDYMDIFSLVKSSGYDVLTFDNRLLPLETKVFMLNELCDCVIGYEGGMMHFAHVLKIPSIILPWRYGTYGQDLFDYGLPTEHPPTQLMHLDRRTHFVKDISEIHAWDTNFFKNKIEELHSNLGNNVFLNNTRSFDNQFNNIRCYVESGEHLRELQCSTMLSDFEREFVQTYYKEVLFDGSPIVWHA